LALRRKQRGLNDEERRSVYALDGLFRAGEAVVIGPIRQELLSGVSGEGFEKLQARMSILADLPLNTDIHVLAATYFNTLRKTGIAGGDIDMMICAASWTYGAEIFTGDPDFLAYAAHLPIRLYSWRGKGDGKRPWK
jgi:predicted nucleic acid-binding protein